MNTNRTNTLEGMMKLINELPAVKLLMEEQNQAAVEEETKARSECLDRLKSLRIEERNAISERDAAVKKLRAAEENLMVLKGSVAIAAQAASSAAQARQSAEQSLITTNGENHITKTLYILYRMRSECEKKAQSAEHLQFIDIVVNGQIISRRKNPEFVGVREGLDAKLSAINSSIAFP